MEAQLRAAAERAGDPPPRKVIVVTFCHAMYGPYPGLRTRCEELQALIDRGVQQSRQRYGRGPDLIVLPEFALTDTGRPAGEAAMPPDGEGVSFFRDVARQLGAYLVVPLVTRVGGDVYNSAVLLGRDGRTVGRYDKVHVCPDEPPATTFEGGTTPGKGYPVFDCDFGRLGLQICFDYAFEEGWRVLRRQGAELVAWPSQSPHSSSAKRCTCSSAAG